MTRVPPLRRSIRKTALVVGEGRETEYNYFVALNGDDQASYAITVKRGDGFSPRRAVERAIHEKRKGSTRYDEIWCVFDVEDIEGREEVIEAVSLASANKIRVCLSNPSIEVWFLAHFTRTSRAFKDCDAVIVELSKYWHAVCAEGYSKSDPDIFKRLRSKLGTAYSNAQWVRHCPTHGDREHLYDCNSSTEMFGIVSRFLKI